MGRLLVQTKNHPCNIYFAIFSITTINIQNPHWFFLLLYIILQYWSRRIVLTRENQNVRMMPSLRGEVKRWGDNLRLGTWRLWRYGLWYAYCFSCYQSELCSHNLSFLCVNVYLNPIYGVWLWGYRCNDSCLWQLLLEEWIWQELV